MATLKCLACGHDNNVGDESCASCSSSLNLKLCSACEAINANNAERCHSCKAEFRAEPEVVSFEMDASPVPLVEELAPVGRTLPAVWRLSAEGARTPRSRSAAALAVLALVLAFLPLVVVAGLAYYFYAPSHAAKAEPSATLEAAAKREPDPKAHREVAPSESARLQAAEPGQAPPAAVSGKIAPSRPASAASRNAPSPEPKRAAAAVPHTVVTHTRAANVDAAGKTGADTAAKTTAATLPAAPIPVVATPAPAASAAILPVSESAAAVADPRRASVTHTKGDLNELAVTTTAPAAVTQAPTAPAEPRSDEQGACAPAVVALSLCKTR